MGELVRFRAAAARAKTAQSAATTAEILLFTGVRYQRTGEASPTSRGGDLGAPPSGTVGGAGGGRRKRRG